MTMAVVLGILGIAVCILMISFAYETYELRREAERLRRMVQTYEKIDRLERQALKRMRKMSARS